VLAGLELEALVIADLASVSLGEAVWEDYGQDIGVVVDLLGEDLLPAAIGYNVAKRVALHPQLQDAASQRQAPIRLFEGDAGRRL